MRYILLFLVFSSTLIGQVFYTEADVSYVYTSWTNACTSEELAKPIFLKKRGTAGDSYFCNQGIGNPDVIVNQNGTFYIYSGGDEDLNEKKVGDAIVLIIRRLSGYYDLEKGCTGTIMPILHFAPDDYCEDPEHSNSQCLWSKVGGLGHGMAVVYSSQPDVCGHHYFGVVPVWDKGDRELEELPDTRIEKYQDDRAYLAWAVSEDGINWKFLNDSNLAPIKCSNWETDDPKAAFPFLHRDCFQTTCYGKPNGSGREVFHHVSAFYSDPTKHDRYGNWGDGYIYIIFGYTIGGGIWNLMARIKLDLETSFGLGQIELYQGDTNGLYCTPEGQFQILESCNASYNCQDPNCTYDDPSTPEIDCPCISTECVRWELSKPGDACIPCGFDVNGNKYVFDLSEPLDWKPIYKDNLLLEHFLIYRPSYDFPNAQTVMRVSNRIVPPFYFSEERPLGNCKISENGYSPCEAGGADIAIVQPPCTQYWKNLGYYDENCNPIALVSYFNATYKVCPSAPDITQNPGGFIVSKLSLTNQPWTYPMCYYGEGLKIRKQGQNLHLYWTPSTDSKVNAYRVYEGNMIEKIENNETKIYFLKDGTHCSSAPEDDQIPYDHYRKICYTENNYVDIPICEEENCKRQEYYLIAPLCDRGRQLFQCFNGTNYFPLAYISEGPFCPGTNIKRERGTCHCPEDDGCGGFYEYFSQPGDTER